MRKYLLVPIAGQVEEIGGSAFVYAACPVCGNRVRKQIRDLNLVSVELISGPFTTTMDGDLIVKRELAGRLKEKEPSLLLKPAILDNEREKWVQVVPVRCLELHASSLRSPREDCGECGGIARVQFGSVPSLRLQPIVGRPPDLAHICGAPLMPIVSEAVAELLSPEGWRSSFQGVVL